MLVTKLCGMKNVVEYVNKMYFENSLTLPYILAHGTRIASYHSKVSLAYEKTTKKTTFVC